MVNEHKRLVVGNFIGLKSKSSTCLDYKLGKNKALANRAVRRKARQIDRDMLVKLETYEFVQPKPAGQRGSIVGASARGSEIRIFRRD